MNVNQSLPTRYRIDIDNEDHLNNPADPALAAKPWTATMIDASGPVGSAGVGDSPRTAVVALLPEVDWADLATPGTLTDTEQLHVTLTERARDAGLPIMDASGGVLSVILDRENIAPSTLSELDAATIFDLYELFIGPAIDALEDHLRNH